jgi:hypothetical protein
MQSLPVVVFRDASCGAAYHESVERQLRLVGRRVAVVADRAAGVEHRFAWPTVMRIACTETAGPANGAERALALDGIT